MIGVDFSSENFINYTFRNKSFKNPLKPIDRYIEYIKQFVWQVYNLSFSYSCHVNELRNHHLDLSPHKTNISVTINMSCGPVD